jgi:hypothetical protein
MCTGPFKRQQEASCYCLLIVSMFCIHYYMGDMAYLQAPRTRRKHCNFADSVPEHLNAVDPEPSHFGEPRATPDGAL